MSFLEDKAANSLELAAWLNRRENYLSHDIQNELLQIMAHKIQRKILTQIQRSPFYSVIAEETTDISGKEQFSVCVRFVDDDF